MSNDDKRAEVSFFKDKLRFCIESSPNVYFKLNSFNDLTFEYLNKFKSNLDYLTGHRFYSFNSLKDNQINAVSQLKNENLPLFNLLKEKYYDITHKTCDIIKKKKNDTEELSYYNWNGNVANECSDGEKQLIDFLYGIFMIENKIILIDEPCVNLSSSNFIKIRDKYLCDISKNQLIVISHNSDIIGIKNTNNIIYFCYYNNKFRSTSIKTLNEQDQKIIFESKDILFAEKCLLVEGYADVKFVHALCQQNLIHDYTIIPMESKFSTMYRILDKLQINYKVMYDYDAAFKDGDGNYAKATLISEIEFENEENISEEDKLIALENENIFVWNYEIMDVEGILYHHLKKDIHELENLINQTPAQFDDLYNEIKRNLYFKNNKELYAACENIHQNNNISESNKFKLITDKIEKSYQSLPNQQSIFNQMTWTDKKKLINDVKNYWKYLSVYYLIDSFEKKEDIHSEMNRLITFLRNELAYTLRKKQLDKKTFGLICESAANEIKNINDNIREINKLKHLNTLNNEKYDQCIKQINISDKNIDSIIRNVIQENKNSEKSKIEFKLNKKNNKYIDTIDDGLSLFEDNQSSCQNTISSPSFASNDTIFDEDKKVKKSKRSKKAKI
jgi:hypothetical protein